MSDDLIKRLRDRTFLTGSLEGLAASRIEQLERERDEARKYRDAYLAERNKFQLYLQRTHADLDLEAAAVEALTSKLAKAVEALHFYADFYEAPNDGPWGINSDDFGTRARTALAELEGKNE